MPNLRTAHKRRQRAHQKANQSVIAIHNAKLKAYQRKPPATKPVSFLQAGLMPPPPDTVWASQTHFAVPLSLETFPYPTPDRICVWFMHIPDVHPIFDSFMLMVSRIDAYRLEDAAAYARTMPPDVQAAAPPADTHEMYIAHLVPGAKFDQRPRPWWNNPQYWGPGVPLVIVQQFHAEDDEIARELGQVFATAAVAKRIPVDPESVNSWDIRWDMEVRNAAVKLWQKRNQKVAEADITPTAEGSEGGHRDGAGDLEKEPERKTMEDHRGASGQ